MNFWTFGKRNPVHVHALELRSVAHVSYVLVDPSSRTAAVIDPPPDVDPCLEIANRWGARVRHVFLTKFHSDFETGHQALVERSGATLYTGAWGHPEYDHLPLKDGDILQFGNTSLSVLETPGHVLEGMTLVASQTESTDAPWGVFPGDLLFDGDFARPEPRLDDGFSVEDLAGMLYDSLHRKLLTLPPGVRLLPGHRPRSGTPDSLTIGAVRRSHPLLRPQTRRSFVSALTLGRLPAPLTRSTRNTLNRSTDLCRTIGLSSRIPELAPLEVLAAADRGTVILDLREPMEFAAGHVPGSFSLGLGAHFEPWAASLLDPTDDHILICNPGSEEEATLRLRPLIGFRITGLFSRGMADFEDLAERLERVLPAKEGPARRPDPAAIRVNVGTRARASRSAIRIPLEELLGRLDELPSPPEALEVIDEDPQRAWSAASLLRRMGWFRTDPGVAATMSSRRPAVRC